MAANNYENRQKTPACFVYMLVDPVMFMSFPGQTIDRE